MADLGKPFRWTGGAIASVASWLARAIAAAVTSVARAIAAAIVWIGLAVRDAVVWLWGVIVTLSPWLFGLAALAGPYVLLETLGSKEVSAWSDVYIAGAVGGLILELLRGRWRLELPSKGRGIGKGAEQSFAPFGPLTDIGFFGRMTTGAVAAPVFLAILNALDASEAQARDLSSYLATLAPRADTIAWGVLIGALSPAVWTMGESLVKGRFAIADTRVDAMKTNAETIAKELKARQAKLVEAAVKAQPAAPTAPVVASPEAQNRVAGVVEERLGSDDATMVRKALESNGTAAQSAASFEEITREFLEQQSVLSKAIGALEASAAVADAGPTGTAPPTAKS
jgi:hypothetical protein